MVFFLGVCACTSKEKEAEAPNQQVSAEKNRAQISAEDFDVRIEPARPTVLSDLQALCSGTETTTYQWTRNGRVLQGETGSRLPRTQYIKGDTISVTASAGNRFGTASVIINNTPPVITSVAFNPKDVSAGQDITALPEGQDPDGDEVRYSYRWSINGDEGNDDSPLLKGDRFKRGDILLLTIVPSDGEGEGRPFRSEPVTVPNSSPRIISTPPQMNSSNVYTYAVAARDPDGDEVSYSLVSAPQGMAIDAKSGLLTWPITSESGGEHSIEIVAQDQMGAKSVQKFNLTISITEQGK